MLRTTGESERLLTCRRKTSTVAVVLLAVSSCVNGFAFNTAGLVRPMASSPSSGVRVRHASHIRRVSPGKAAGSLERSISATDGHAPRMAAGSEGEELGFVEKFKIGWATEIPAGDPADLPPCPSGVSDMAKPIQVTLQQAYGFSPSFKIVLFFEKVHTREKVKTRVRVRVNPNSINRTICRRPRRCLLSVCGDERGCLPDGAQ